MSSPTDPKTRLNLEQQRKRAKDLLRAHRSGNLDAAVRVAKYLPRAQNNSPEELLSTAITLSEAQFIIAREAGFSSWPKMKHHLDEFTAQEDIAGIVIDAALAGHDDLVRSTLLKDSGAILQSIHAVCAAGDADAALALLESNPQLANDRGGQRNWTPLLYLCCSRYRRNDEAVTKARLRVAQRLLEAGADVNAAGLELGYTAAQVNLMFDEHEWRPIDGAAARLDSVEIVKLLLAAGADLNQTSEIVSQVVRTGNIDILKIVLDAGPKDWWQLGWALKACVVLEKPEIAMILIPYLAPPRIPAAALLEAIRLEKSPDMIEVLLGDNDEHPRKLAILRDAYRAAIRYGQHAAVELLRRRGRDAAAVTDMDRVIAAAINNSPEEMRRILSSSPHTSLSADDHPMLSWAIRTQRFSAVPLLLEAGLDPNVSDRDGDTPLHLAVKTSATETIDALLAAAAKLDLRNFEAQTPLDTAVALPDRTSRDEMIRKLLAAGARPALETTRLDQEELHVLFEKAADAVVFGELETLRDLLDDEPFLVHARSPRPHRATLLHYCGANGTEDPRQRTPANAPAIAQLLLDRGSDVNATCNFYGGGATTLGLTLTSIHPVRAGVLMPLAETLMKAGAAEGLMAAASLGQIERVRSFFTAASSPPKSEVQSAFMWACQFGRTHIVDFLLDHGAGIAFQNGNGMTGLHMAAGAGHLDTVKLLISRAAPLELKNVWGGSVLGSVLWFALNHDPNVDYAPIVEAVIGAGANVSEDWADWWRQQSPLSPASKDRIARLLVRQNTSDLS
jgi:ankyrin repeat protein